MSSKRIRTLKREFFESPTVMTLPSLPAILTFAGLNLMQADDRGRVMGRNIYSGSLSSKP